MEVTNEETVTFKSAGNGFLNDLTNAQTPVIETGAIGSEVPVPTTRPASGCEFVYWTNSEGEKVELGETVKVPLGGETYTAHFAKVKYTVRFEITDPVSYTHLDVYKRQSAYSRKRSAVASSPERGLSRSQRGRTCIV